VEKRKFMICPKHLKGGHNLAPYRKTSGDFRCNLCHSIFKPAESQLAELNTIDSNIDALKYARKELLKETEVK